MAYQKLQAGRALKVTPDDLENIPSPSAENGLRNDGCVLYIGTGGNLKVMTVGGDETLFVNVQDGTFFPVQVLRVFDTETTASNIVALW